ncbi:6-phosphogluconolactonase [Lichenibacterium minor]|jgi:6-phosphogluconolactonase|uniref:6-phosphogluconolactonase n=1 Tax=Lichenibacterium minor TaxID=2316528 RepID=A0A4Q2U467_9HYPH|nr:6-phosphogluconolactonase [Lichenibacterium minor]RYC30588.1 6-phosphogluconolactonase [Lichenibacterium minor]
MTDRHVAQGEFAVFDDPDAVADAAASWLVRQAEGKERFAVSLSGGSTPKRLYERLASAAFRDRFPWDRTDWFFGDERFVPKDDQDSNFRMVEQAMLAHVPVPEGRVHSFDTAALTPEDAAAAYERRLKRFYGADTLDPARPLFDVTLLGLGPDGHTASLIPGQPVLDERDRWSAAVTEGRPEARLTLTYPAIASSRAIAFLVTGKDKADMVAHIRSGAADVPAGRLRSSGEVRWFLDRAAAGQG